MLLISFVPLNHQKRCDKHHSVTSYLMVNARLITKYYSGEVSVLHGWSLVGLMTQGKRAGKQLTFNAINAIPHLKYKSGLTEMEKHLFAIKSLNGVYVTNSALIGHRTTMDSVTACSFLRHCVQEGRLSGNDQNLKRGMGNPRLRKRAS